MGKAGAQLPACCASKQRIYKKEKRKENLSFFISLANPSYADNPLRTAGYTPSNSLLRSRRRSSRSKATLNVGSIPQPSLAA